MKRTISFFAAILLMLSISIQAQMRMSHEERLKQYQERLKLTDKQTKSVDSILLKMEEKMKNARDTEDRSQRREAFMKIMDDTNKQIEKILTPSQKEEFKKMLDERRSRMKQMMGGGGGQ